MGILGFHKLIESNCERIIQNISLDRVNGGVAIDAQNYFYHLLSENIKSLQLFNITETWKESQCMSIIGTTIAQFKKYQGQNQHNLFFVFDGCPPDAKTNTIIKNREKRFKHDVKFQKILHETYSANWRNNLACNGKILKQLEHLKPGNQSIFINDFQPTFVEKIIKPNLNQLVSLKVKTLQISRKIFRLCVKYIEELNDPQIKVILSKNEADDDCVKLVLEGKIGIIVSNDSDIIQSLLFTKSMNAVVLFGCEGNIFKSVRIGDLYNELLTNPRIREKKLSNSLKNIIDSIEYNGPEKADLLAWGVRHTENCA